MLYKTNQTVDVSKSYRSDLAKVGRQQ
ncbi:hypothetical protein MY1884_003313 [Beauveria asiatica]